ncbi:hypothetical protein Tsubulata_011127 [Turnera subulata]|uniref:HMA domain-containing protein n=1 Tax=Turnera subulata TaxID=218843 RepID=A0A9Q0J602_9ROSI|nr:hypothetical protein Tsubulata_011127 [Turnera subulata]
MSENNKTKPVDSPAAGHMTCELQVDTQSPGWHKTMTKVLKGINGLSFTIDASRGIARVSGQIEPTKLMALLAKAGKHADLLWVDAGNHYKNTTTGSGNQQNVQDNSNRYNPMGYGYGYYPNNPYSAYGRMGYYSMDPRSQYYYQQQQYPHYYSPYSFYM